MMTLSQPEESLKTLSLLITVLSFLPKPCHRLYDQRTCACYKVNTADRQIVRKGMALNTLAVGWAQAFSTWYLNERNLPRLTNFGFLHFQLPTESVIAYRDIAKQVWAEEKRCSLRAIQSRVVSSLW